MHMQSDIRAAVVALGLFSGLTGVVYPLLVTGIATTAMPLQARGSLIRRGDTIRGSALVGQSFSAPRYLWGRPSAIRVPYDARGSSGSNLGPTNPTLDTLVRERVAALRASDSATAGSVPVELVTASASGLDPHLSPAAAMFQAARIARVRSLDAAAVARLITSFIEPRTLGILGEPRVNVLRVNLALDSLSRSLGTQR
jgi:potassium-transporting ATPase KdpC subunit